MGELAFCRRPPEGEVLRLVIDELVRFSEGVVAVARPGVVLGGAHHPSAYGVQVTVAHHREDVAAVDVGLDQRGLHPLGDYLAVAARLPSVVPAGQEPVDEQRLVG